MKTIILMPIMISMTSYYHNSNPFRRTSDVLINKSKIAILVSLLSAAFFISSCTETPTIIGSGLLPGQDFLNIRSTDKINVFSYTEFIDSVRTNNRTYSYLGGLHDPYFGDMTADFVAQIRLLKKWAGGGPIVVDSVKLFYSIAGAKGTLGTAQELRMYEINEMLIADSNYYSNRDPHAGNQIASVILPEITKDTILNFEVGLPKQFGEHLMDTIHLNQEGGADDFRSYFKGIYFTIREAVKSAKGSRPAVSPLMALTFNAGDFDIRVYYHNAKTYGLYHDFVINVNSVRYNLYSFLRDATTTDPDKIIKHVGDGVKDSLSYMQAFNGVYTRLNFPDLAQFKDSGKVSINRARLEVSVFLDEVLYKSTTVPSIIYLSYRDKDGIRTKLPDIVISPTYFGGSFNGTTTKYSFNIASFVQEYLEGRIADPEVEMYLAEGEYKNAILRANTSTLPVKLVLTYTKF
jgi:hypothetical protein